MNAHSVRPTSPDCASRSRPRASSRKALESDEGFAAAIHGFVARTPSVLAMIQVDDLLGEKVAVNLPGTDRERPNWRRKFSREIVALPPLPRG